MMEVSPVKKTESQNLQMVKAIPVILSMDEDLAIVRAAYRVRNAERQLNIIHGELFDKPYNHFSEWIK